MQNSQKYNLQLKKVFSQLITQKEGQLQYLLQEGPTKRKEASNMRFRLANFKKAFAEADFDGSKDKFKTRVTHLIFPHEHTHIHPHTFCSVSPRTIMETSMSIFLDRSNADCYFADIS